MRLPKNRPPIHPGEILLEEFLKPHGISQTDIALRIRVSRKHINDLVHGRKPISTDIALRLSRFLGTSPELWLNGQIAWDIWHQLHSRKANELNAIKPLAAHG